MPIQTRIKYADFRKAVQLLAVLKGHTCSPYKGKKGSQYCFEFFHEGENEPFRIVCYHEDLRAKVVYSDDLKKVCDVLGVSKKEFESFIENDFKLPNI